MACHAVIFKGSKKRSIACYAMNLGSKKTQHGLSRCEFREEKKTQHGLSRCDFRVKKKRSMACHALIF